jgi:signal transduction histidine kinase
LYSQRTKNKQQLAIIDAISQTQENERKRIATALHDSIGSALAGIRMQIENVFSDRYPSKSARQTVQLIDETANEVRRISHDLIPGVLLKLGLEDSLKDMINHIDNNTSIQTSYESFGMDKRLPSETEVKIFRICQELVQNALKHGKPDRLNLQITRHANELNIILEDNGQGFDKSSYSSDGIGMANMKHQVSTMKGNLQVESTKGQGTTVIIDIPFT